VALSNLRQQENLSVAMSNTNGFFVNTGARVRTGIGVFFLSIRTVSNNNLVFSTPFYIMFFAEVAAYEWML
jgi:hypothetical protein